MNCIAFCMSRQNGTGCQLVGEMGVGKRGVGEMGLTHISFIYHCPFHYLLDELVTMDQSHMASGGNHILGEAQGVKLDQMRHHLLQLVLCPQCLLMTFLSLLVLLVFVVL